MLAFAILGVILGDFLSTFIWHVPEHAFGKLHVTTHHAKDRGFSHYAVLSPKLNVMLDGILGIIPYFFFWPVWVWVFHSPMSILLGYLFGQFHVIWRHTTALGWQTPTPIVRLCNLLFIVTPEDHWEHHKNAHQAFGDIFTFYDVPARMWLKFLLGIKRKYRRYSRNSIAI